VPVQASQSLQIEARFFSINFYAPSELDQCSILGAHLIF